MNALEVMDEAADRYRAVHSYDKAADMTDARAAVAELIAKVERLERKAIVKGKFTASVFISDVEAVRAALARCKGGAA